MAWQREQLVGYETLAKPKLKVDAGTSQKAPTLISYHSDGIQWGYQVDDMNTTVRAVKLLLDSSQTVRYIPAAESERMIRALKKEPVDVTGDYMRTIVSHAKEILHRRGMGKLLKRPDIKYILTIPGVWSDKAKDLTMQAACLAGIPRNNLTLLSEPEAAAVYAIQTIQPRTLMVSIHGFHYYIANAY